MDVFTHFVTGATLGVVFFEEKLTPIVGGKSLWVSILLGGAIGIFPDIDVFNKKFKTYLYYIENHRKWSHSIFLHIIVSCVVGIIFNYFCCPSTTLFTTENLKVVSFVFAILFSHILLDFFTSWGLYYLYPIKKRFATSSVYVIDFFVFLAMIIQLVFLFSDKVQYWPIIVVVIYLVIGLIIKKLFVVPVFKKQLLQQDIKYYELDVRPTFLNTFLWSANIRLKEGYATGYYSIFQKENTIVFFEYSKNTDLLFKNEEYDTADLLVLKNRFQAVVGNWYSFSEINGKLHINDVRYVFKTFNIGETRFAQPYLIYKNNKGKLDIKLEQQLVKGWINKLIERIFAS